MESVERNLKARVIVDLLGGMPWIEQQLDRKGVPWLLKGVVKGVIYNKIVGGFEDVKEEDLELTFLFFTERPEATAEIRELLKDALWEPEKADQIEEIINREMAPMLDTEEKRENARVVAADIKQRIHQYSALIA